MLLTTLLLVAADPALEEYARLTSGSYTSAAQAAADPRYDIVEAEIVRLWPERSDGVWVYQEQAIINRPGLTTAQAKAAPYFQRVGHIHRKDGRLIRDNYSLKDPKRFVGNPAAITPADLAEAGCHNLLDRVAPGYWIARTEGCRNGYKGAVEMRSVSVHTADAYANWDRGFAADGSRVWGPVDGGYVFRKK
jgi:hypothetical protein